MEDVSNKTNENVPSTTKKDLYEQCLESSAYLDVLATASTKADDAYAKKKPPKEHPWPKEHFLKDIKHIRPAKIAMIGPDKIGTSTTLDQLYSCGYEVMHRPAQTSSAIGFCSSYFHQLVKVWQECCQHQSTIITDASPWKYYFKYMLLIAPEQRT